MKLKYELKQSGHTVIFRVLNMDERFMGRKFISDDHLEIYSLERPDISAKKIFLRGTELNCDRDYCYLGFVTVIDAEKYFCKVQESLKSWAENWQGWNKAVEDPAVGEGYFIL